jgi:glucose-6-phosphate isomerase
MPEHLAFDPGAALDDRLGAGRGIPRAAYTEAAGALADHAAWLDGERAAGRLGFLDLPLDPGPAAAITTWMETAPPARDVVLVGIGGSALTARIVDALRPATSAVPRLHVLDTVDPFPVVRLMERLDPGSTWLVGISKSGGTLETTAVFPVLEAWMTRALGPEAAARLVAVCGEQPNPLRERALARGYATFDVPVGIGGRYSALTPVGLLPAACVGLDPRGLLQGAAAVRGRLLDADPDGNPAIAMAALHHAAWRSGRRVAVIWPYGEALGPVGPWWVQLVGESLGKPGPDGPVGPTPLAARGPADQHSLLQLLTEGPDDKLTVFVTAPAEDGPDVPDSGAGLCKAAGRPLGTILAAEQEATAFALAEAGRPTATVHLTRADAACVCAFLLTCEVAVVLWARLLGVDPFGQPGVELGKRAALARLTGEPADLAARLAQHRGA